jgi:hypothetical protein
MLPVDEDIMRRVREFALRCGLTLHSRLGFGKDGSVWESDQDSAIKVFRSAIPYRRELAAYRRLAEHSVVQVAGCAVPQLLRTDEELLVIEMTIVVPPFVLDFASAYLDDDAPEFSEEVLAEWLADKQEEFGDRWPRAASVLHALRRLGIHMTDVHPANFNFDSPPS